MKTIKQIIKEEINDFDWINDIEPKKEIDWESGDWAIKVNNEKELFRLLDFLEDTKGFEHDSYSGRNDIFEFFEKGLSKNKEIYVFLYPNSGSIDAARKPWFDNNNIDWVFYDFNEVSL
jgi:calcineurin-like phosphoesterase family protein